MADTNGDADADAMFTGHHTDNHIAHVEERCKAEPASIKTQHIHETNLKKPTSQARGRRKPSACASHLRDHTPFEPAVAEAGAPAACSELMLCTLLMEEPGVPLLPLGFFLSAFRTSNLPPCPANGHKW